MLDLGYIIFAVVYFGFAYAYNKIFMIVLFVMYGVYTALIAGVEMAFVAENGHGKVCFVVVNTAK